MTSRLFFTVLVLTMSMNGRDCLKCYQCGDNFKSCGWNGWGVGELVTCPPGFNYCARTWNWITRSPFWQRACSPYCIETDTQTGSTYCCNTDKCNRSELQVKRNSYLYLFTLFIFLLRL